MISTIAARELISAGKTIDYPLLTVENGRILDIESLPQHDHVRFPATHRFPGATLVPSYIDIHIHGGSGHDVMEATPHALAAIETYLASRGVGAYLPTTITSSRDETLRALAGLATHIRQRRQQRDSTGALPLGIHLEGPFLSHRKRGVHTDSLLEAPSLTLFESFWQAAEGHIQLMTIAPELPGADALIAHATSLGVRCSLGHSDATVAQAHAGFVAGARSATHTFNAMRSLDHRDPGIAAYVLDQPDLFADIICDGIHIDPIMVRLFLKAKGKDRIVLITDGISATGMPDGTYMLGEIQVEVKAGRCTSNGTLAGSVLTLDHAVRNFIEFTGASLDTAIAAVTRNPAQLLGIDDTWGTLDIGRPANITVLSPSSQVIQTFQDGRPASAIG